jgi:NADH dehydrogenase
MARAQVSIRGSVQRFAPLSHRRRGRGDVMEGSAAQKARDDVTVDNGVDGAMVRVAQPGPAKLLERLAHAKHRVVVLGGGFAGVYTAKYLTNMLGSRRDVHVELLSEENYFVFQPLLPEVAAGGVNATHVVNPIRDIVPRAQFRWSKVQSVDVHKKIVYAAQGEGKELVAVPYDHLVFALGKVSDFSSMPGVAEHGLAMKDLSDAFRLRNHVFRCLELADVEDDVAEKQALLTFAVAGGGFSGVETIGELAELLHKCTRQFKNIDPSEVRMVLIHSRDLLLPEMPEKLGRAAEKDLRRRNVKMMMNARVKAATPQAVYLNTGEVLPTRTFICTVGNAPNPVVKKILKDDGFAEGKIKGRGIGVFEADLELQCTGQTHYWAVGDCAGVPNPRVPGELCPATAQFAIRQAKTCARNILAAVDGKPAKRRKFNFKALGSLASLGNRSAVADMMGVKLTGFIAWFAWRTVYLSKLPGVVRRLRVTIDWTLDLFFPRDITQLQTLRKERLRVDHYEPGEHIIEKTEIGRELFVIQNGEVEVFEPAHGGEPERHIATFGRGEVFGEKALLTDTPRTASVRAKSAVDVLVVGRSDFRALVDQFPVLDDHFDDLLRKRYPEALAQDAKLKTLVADAVNLPR